MALGDPWWVRNLPEQNEGPPMDWKDKALFVVTIALGVVGYGVALWWLYHKWEGP